MARPPAESAPRARPSPVFTGIIEQVCAVLEVVPKPGARRLRLDLGPLRQQTGESTPLAVLGDSVAVNGACLTVAELEGDVAAFDVVTETLERTSLGALEPGGRVNVERALRLGDRLVGPLVQGHVEAIGEVERVDTQDGQTWFRIRCGAEFASRTLFKGSVCIDGVSLTVAELGDEHLAVALVPHTLERTTLGRLSPGTRVNLEPDMIGSWVRRTLEGMDLVPRPPR